MLMTMLLPIIIFKGITSGVTAYATTTKEGKTAPTTTQTGITVAPTTLAGMYIYPIYTLSNM